MSIIRVRYFLAYICIAVGMLYCSGHSYSIVASSLIKVAMILLCFIGCVIIEPTITKHKRLTSTGLMILSISLGALLSFAFHFRENVWLDPVMLIGIMLVAYYITEKVSFDTFINYYGATLGMLSLVAIVVNLMTSTGIQIPSLVYEGMRGISYNTLGICTWISNDYRLMGPFWEPGLYSTFAIVGVFLETCFVQGRKARIWVLASLTIGIFMSQSTAGYLLLFLTYYIAFHKSRKIQLIWDVIAVVLVLTGLFFQDYITILLYNSNEEVFWKLTQVSISGTTRLQSPLVCLRIFLIDPICGNGMSLAISKYTEMISSLKMDALTSTSTFMLAAFGVWGISYTLLWVSSFSKVKDFSLVIRILMIFLFLIIINKEPHYNLMITYVLLFYISKSHNVSVGSGSKSQYTVKV